MKKKEYLKQRARELRNDSTIGEAILWKEVLRAKKFFGLQWNRQFPIEDYIVDFICRKLKLIIELDGNYHDLIIEKDQLRDKRLAELGYQVIRIPEKDVMQDVNSVYHYLKRFVPESMKREFEKKQSI